MSTFQKQCTWNNFTKSMQFVSLFENGLHSFFGQAVPLGSSWLKYYKSVQFTKTYQLTWTVHFVSTNSRKLLLQFRKLFVEIHFSYNRFHSIPQNDTFGSNCKKICPIVARDTFGPILDNGSLSPNLESLSNSSGFRKQCISVKLSKSFSCASNSLKTLSVDPFHPTPWNDPFRYNCWYCCKI